MSNKTIPQLPEQTGKTDNDLLAIVDSGETTTSKIKVSTLLSGVGADYWEGTTTGTTNQLITDFTSIDAAFAANTVLTTGTVNDSLVVGWNNTTTRNDGSQFFGNNINGVGVSIGTDLSNQTDDSVNIGQDNAALKSDVCIGNNIVNTGNNPNSIAIGRNTKALNFRGMCIGSNSQNTGNIGLVVGYQSTNSATYSSVFGYTNDASGGTGAAILGGYANDITSSGNHNTIVGGTANLISGSVSGSTILGLQSFTATKDDMVYLPALTFVDYASYNFADDSAAATGGVELGGIYHNAGALRVRIS